MIEMKSNPLDIKEGTMNSEEFKEHSENENQALSRLKIMKNLIISSLAIFLVYLPFQSLTNIQSTMNFENNVGVISQAIIYSTNIFSCLFLPKLIIKKLGCKHTMVLCILLFLPFLAANFYPHMGSFFPTACFLGLGTGVLWSTIGYYIYEISTLYADCGIDTAEIVISKFFGIFYMAFQNAQVWGNLVTFYILRPYENTTFEESFLTQNYTHETFEKNMFKTWNVTCGADFCGGMNENLEPPTIYKRYILISVYLIFVIVSALSVLLFMDPLKQKSEKEESVFSRVIATGKHLRDLHQLLLIPLTMFCGIEEAFIVADFSKGYVGCASGLYNVSLVYVCFGVVNATMSFFSGRLIQYVPRASLLLSAAVINVGVGIALLLWHPTADALVYFFFVVGVMGLCDAIWRTHLHTFYGVRFKEEQEAAFANFRLWESVGFALGFGYSGFLCMHQTIYILIAFILVGITGYITVEIRQWLLDFSYNVSETQQKE